ncbi:hypothetical protein FACS189487_10710 [Campylobacterota bacterium]|nr:hypothetical protein FACS189487_10710 [Campylobacterota bacterium]
MGKEVMNDISESRILMPKKCVASFISAMQTWEIWLYSENRKTEYIENSCYRENVLREAHDKLFEIFTEHLTLSAIEKIGGRLSSLSPQKPPEYEQTIESNHEEIKDHYFIYAQQERGFKHRIKYELIIENVQWKINSAFVWHTSKNKWIKSKAI